MTTMKNILLTCLLLCTVLFASSKQIENYQSIDPKSPILFEGDHIIFQDNAIQLGPKAFFIDGQMTNEQAAKYPYVFNSVNEAAEHLTDGTEDSPMVLYIAPWVYWIDDPDDPAIREAEPGSAPFGLVIQCEWLRFYGLTDNPENVVLACNRGQTMGAKGNFTMFKITGNGTSAENITFGNYCNVDLEFPLKSGLNREKRGSAIVQAQLVFCQGDKIFARNTHFISRLNLLPFYGGERTLFDHCHFESTDDALAPRGVYLNSTFEFYSSKPFGHTAGTGAVFLNCDIKSFTRGEQYFVKGGGQMVAVDCRMESELTTYWGWKNTPALESRNYHFNNHFNGKKVAIDEHYPYASVDMTNKQVLDAYRIEYNNQVIYNTYNLLRGDDDWDPMGIKEMVSTAEKSNGKNYTQLSVQLKIAPTQKTIETGKNDVQLNGKIFRFGSYESTGEPLTWAVAPDDSALVGLKVSDDGMACVVIPTNRMDETRQVVVTARTASGLEAASVLKVAPSILEAPKFSSLPKISGPKNGKLSVDYKLDMRFEDQSLVSWYRCTDANGSNPIEVAVSRLNQPLREYELSAGDVGYYLMVSVAPKHLRCDAGEAVTAVTRKPVSVKDVKTNPKVLLTDFFNIAIRNQPKVIPGFWTFDHLDAIDHGGRRPTNKENDAWYFGEGQDGAVNQLGLLQSGRSASMLYTPVRENLGNMKLTMSVAPYKTAGQGFSVAHMYMDVLLKLDTKTMTGYALRFIRTTKYGNAVDCIFMKYENDKFSEISEPLSTSCFRTPCNIRLEIKGNKIIAHATTTAEYYKASYPPEVFPEVNMEMEIKPTQFGGFGILYNGGARTMFKELKVEWE